MATKTRFIRDCRAANDSKAYATAVFNLTPTKDARRLAYRQACQDAGMPGAEMAGDLLAHLEWAIRCSTCQFGAYDSAETIRTHLGWRSRDQVKRNLAKLKEYGFLETALGIPKGRTGPTNHYRFTHKLGRLMLALVNRLKTTAQTIRAKAPKLALCLLPTRTRKRQKPFKSQATRVYTQAHEEFKPNPGRKPATREVAGFHLGKIKSLIGMRG